MNALLRTWAAPAAAALALALGGCGEKPTIVADDAGASAAAKDPKTLLGGKLGAAVAAAESSAKAPSSSSSAGANGPPESGVFTSAGADAALAPGAPAKVEVLNEGKEPRVLLKVAPKGDEQKAVITVSAQIAQVAMALDFALTFKIDRPKSEKGDKDKGESAAPLKVVAQVSSASPPKEMAGQIPKEMTESLGKLKGSEIRFQLGSNGALTDLSTSMSKDVDKSSRVFPLVEMMLRSAGETLSLMSVVVPPKPIGVGGYWMATERVASYPVEVLRYRVVTVEKVEKDHASLSVKVRQYATRADAELGAIAKGEKLHVDVFDSQGTEQLEWAGGVLLSGGCTADLRTTAQSGGQQPGQPKPGLQTELQAKSGQVEKSEKK